METIQMTRDEIASRTGRFAQLQPMEFMKNDTTVTQAAKDIILARKLMPVVLERTQSAFGNDAPIYNAAGLTMFISIMPPGQGPCLHAHVKTFETFTVLDGTLEFSLNDDGGEKIVLNQWDTFSCPPGVNRGFRNVGAKDAVLLTVITRHQRPQRHRPAARQRQADRGGGPERPRGLQDQDGPPLRRGPRGLIGRSGWGLGDAVDHDQVGPAGAEAHREGLAVFLGAIPALRVVHAGELEDHHPVRLSVSLHRLVGAAAHQEATPVRREGRGHALAVLLHQRKVGHGQVHDDVGGHGAPSRACGVPRRCAPPRRPPQRPPREPRAGRTSTA